MTTDISILTVLVRPDNVPAPTLPPKIKPETTGNAPTHPPSGAHHGI
jgi:hypothetical protein